MSLDGAIAYDEHRKSANPASAEPKLSYSQQLEVRVQASHAKGIVLALPTLRDRLNLTPFEKNVVLISLAPEVNRRYARLYHYLQGQDDEFATDLPTVELVLRLLCRNDNEWRSARHQIAQQSSLIQQGLMTLLQQPYDTLLTASVKLSEPLVRYLLAESPVVGDLEALLAKPAASIWTQSLSPPLFGSSVLDGQAIAIPDGGFLETRSSFTDLGDAEGEPEDGISDSYLPPTLLRCIEHPATDWKTVVLPDGCLSDVHHLCHRVRYHHQAAITLGIAADHPPFDLPGIIALFSGASGTGKFLTARAIATDLQLPLHWVDLATVPPEQYPSLLTDMESVSAVFIKAAHLWLATPPCSLIQDEYLRYFLTQRQSQKQITLFSVHEIERIAPEWLREMDHIVQFPLPHQALRLALWEQVFSIPSSHDESIDLSLLSRLTLTGKEIWCVAREGAIAAAARQAPVTMDDIHHALQRCDNRRALRQLTRYLAERKAAQGRSRRQRKPSSHKK